MYRKMHIRFQEETLFFKVSLYCNKNTEKKWKGVYNHGIYR